MDVDVTFMESESAVKQHKLLKVGRQKFPTSRLN